MAEWNGIEIPDRYNTSFWKKVDIRGDDECWEWNLSRDKDGYGKSSICIDGVIYHVRAHQLALILSGFPRGSVKDFSLHSCHNPPCCNPGHLRWGSVRDNALDMIKSGRIAYKKGRDILTDEQAGEILYAFLEMRNKFALKFNVSTRAVRRVIFMKKSERINAPD